MQFHADARDTTRNTRDGLPTIIIMRGSLAARLSPRVMCYMVLWLALIVGQINADASPGKRAGGKANDDKSADEGGCFGGLRKRVGGPFAHLLVASSRGPNWGCSA